MTKGRSPQLDVVLQEPVSAIQPLLDNPFLLLLIGLAVPTALHTLWGVMQLVFLPIVR